jgi:hypothetical protein
MKHTLLQDFAVYLAHFGVGGGVLAAMNVHFHKWRQFFDCSSILLVPNNEKWLDYCIVLVVQSGFIVVTIFVELFDL